MPPAAANSHPGQRATEVRRLVSQTLPIVPFRTVERCRSNPTVTTIPTKLLHAEAAGQRCYAYVLRQSPAWLYSPAAMNTWAEAERRNWRSHNRSPWATNIKGPSRQLDERAFPNTHYQHDTSLVLYNLLFVFLLGIFLANTIITK